MVIENIMCMSETWMTYRCAGIPWQRWAWSGIHGKLSRWCAGWNLGPGAFGGSPSQLKDHRGKEITSSQCCLCSYTGLPRWFHHCLRFEALVTLIWRHYCWESDSSIKKNTHIKGLLLSTFCPHSVQLNPNLSWALLVSVQLYSVQTLFSLKTFRKVPVRRDGKSKGCAISRVL